MKVLMSRNELSTLLNAIQNIITQRPPMPILSNVLIEATQDSKVTITATDLTVGIKSSAPAKVLEEGATTIPARRFAQLIKELPVSYIELATNEKDISQVVADTSTFRLHGMPKVDFPELPNLEKAERIVVKQKDLKKALFKTVFAVSKEETRYIITGVFFQTAQATALCIGTDGKRLARTTIPFQSTSTTPYECIIPAKAVDEIIKNISDTDENATLHLMSDKLAIETDNTIIVTKILSGEYPEVERVIPQQCQHIVALHREELTTLLRQIALFVSDLNVSVRFSLYENTLEIAANTANIGTGRVSMSIHYEGPRLDIAFNPIFFLDVLRHTQGEFVYLGIQDSFNPVVISDAEFGQILSPYPSTLFILMPLRLSGS